MREQQIQGQPDHDRRQAEQGVEGNDEGAAQGNAGHGEQGCEHNAETAGEQRRGQADGEREADDLGGSDHGGDLSGALARR